MRHRRYFRHRRGSPVVADALDSPRRPGLLLWLSGLGVLLYVARKLLG